MVLIQEGIIALTHYVLRLLANGSWLLCSHRGAKYCSQPVCLFVCLSVHSHISITTCSNFTEFFLYVICDVAWSNSDSSAVHYVLPVLWCKWASVKDNAYISSRLPGGEWWYHDVKSAISASILLRCWFFKWMMLSGLFLQNH